MNLMFDLEVRVLRYVKRLYDLIVEAASELGKDGRVFSADEVIRWVRDRYP